MGTLQELLEGLSSGAIEVIDLTAPLHRGTPILALPEEINKTTITQYKVEGTGYDFIPAVCERNIAHEWIKTVDQDSFTMARRLIRQEGLLCGKREKN